MPIMTPLWDLGLSYLSKTREFKSSHVCELVYNHLYILVTLLSTFVPTFVRYSFLFQEKKTKSKLVFPPTELRLACIMFYKKTGPKCRDGGRRIDNKKRAVVKAVQKPKPKISATKDRQKADNKTGAIQVRNQK